MADTRDMNAMLSAFEDREVVIHLAGSSSVDTPWEEVCRNNLPSTMNVLEASQCCRVRRVILASSNHVTGLYENVSPYREIIAGRTEGLKFARIRRIGPESPIRPDGAYALGKAMGEAAARVYFEAFGLSVYCLRLGTVNAENRPTEPRHFSTLLTHGDLIRLVQACLRARPRFGILYGVSRNTWRIWDLPCGIGYKPRDDAERYRDQPSSRRISK